MPSTVDVSKMTPNKNNNHLSGNSDQIHKKSEFPQELATSTKRSRRSSTQDSRKRSSRSSDEATNRSTRPKRRAAASVRFGSYKDMENVDFSLLDHFSFGDRASPAAKSRKKSLPASAKSKKSTLASLKRSALMVSKQSVNPAESLSSENMSKKPASSTAIPAAAKALVVPKQEHARKISGAALEQLLPPVLLRRGKDGYCVMPKLLHHLVSTNGRVDIFNRKTGKILKGKHSVSVKSLATELQAHSEYEPIICPEYPRTSSPTPPIYRQARTSATARVSGEVQPQSRLRASKVVGRAVLITGGPHKGLFGESFSYTSIII